MRVLLLTQDDPFYLGKNIDYLLSNLPSDVQVVGCCMFSASPFGKKQTFFEKSLETWKLFGSRFFLRYSFKYVLAVLDRRNRVATILKKHSVPLVKVSGSINSIESLETIKRKEADLFVSIAGNQIFRRPLFELASKGCINLHSALLPKYRGLMPSFWVLRYNEVKTGVSVFQVDEGIDSGPILVQKEVLIEDKSLEELIVETKRVGMEAVLEAIQKIKSGSFELLPNNDADKTYFSFPKLADVEAFKANGKRFY